MECKAILYKVRLIKEHFGRSNKCLNTGRPTEDESIQLHIQKLITIFEQIRLVFNVMCYYRLRMGQ